MPEPTKVWMVQLDRSPDDIEGTLSLEDATLRFDSPSVGIRTIALETVQRVKRIWGSPVLLVHWLEDGVRRVTAFYFSKPPPLHPEEPTPGAAPPTLMGPFNRSRPPSKRKQRRRNAGYLANASNVVDIDLQAWVKETRAAVAAARSKGD
jgi:hypothetical protein